MRVLMIGGTGFIGRHVVRRLIEAGNSVTLFHRGQTNPELPATVDHISGDRSELQSFASDFKRIAPDVTLDMICYNKQEATELVAALDSTCDRLLVASSMDVYRSYGLLLGLERGSPETGPLNEDSPLRETEYPHRGNPESPADFANYYEKRHVEQVVTSASSLRATILRLPAVYGPGDKYHRTFEYLKRMDDGREKILLEKSRAQWRWTRGYVENVADAIALAVTDDRSAGRIYNVGEPDALSEAEWIRSIGEAAGWRGEVVTLPREEMPAHLDFHFNWEHQLECDTNRIRTDLGYVERLPRGEAMRRTIEWERAHPPDEMDAASFNYAAEDDLLKRLP